MCDASNSSFFRNRNGTLASSARFSRVAAATLSGRLQTRFCLWPRACFPSHRPLLAGFHIGNTQPKRFLAHLFRHAEQTGAVRLRSRGGPDRGLSTDTATTETGTTPTACPLPDTGQRTGGRACTGQRPPPGTHRRAAVLFSCAEFMAEEPVKSKVRSRVPVRVGADCGTGAGDRAGRRGALDRNTQGEVVATSAMASPCTAMCAGFFAFQPARFMCAALFCCPFSGGALIPLLRPLLRQMVHLGKRQAWKPIRGDSLWNWPPPFNVGLKVWRSRASSCPGAVKPPSTGRLTKGEADARSSTALCAIANNMLGAPSRRYAVRPRLRARGFSSRAGRQGQTRERPTTGLPSCLARTRSSRCR